MEKRVLLAIALAVLVLFLFRSFEDRRVKESGPGSQWAVGTEIHLVNRLAAEHPDRMVKSLDDCICMCSTMYRISPQHLCWALERLQEGEVVNRVRVDPETRRWARVALDRMLEIK